MSEERLFPLPELTGRVAVLGGQSQDRTDLCVGLALRQTQQQGIVVCLDAHRRQQLEMPFRLLLRGHAAYLPLSGDGHVPNDTAQQVLQTLQKGLRNDSTPPPLLLIDGVRETNDWQQTLTFFLRTGVIIVEVLAAQGVLPFGRYETLILLQADGPDADSISRTAGRKVRSEDLRELQKGAGFLVHLSQVYRVRFPERH